MTLGAPIDKSNFKKRVYEKHEAEQEKHRRARDMREETDLRRKLKAYLKDNEKAIIE